MSERPGFFLHGGGGVRNNNCANVAAHPAQSIFPTARSAGLMQVINIFGNGLDVWNLALVGGGSSWPRFSQNNGTINNLAGGTINLTRTGTHGSNTSVGTHNLPEQRRR
jgi:hypothetical protein